MTSHRRPLSRQLSSTRLAARSAPGTFLVKAGIGKMIVECAPKASIFSEGDRADSMFYIQKGRVRLSVVSTQGKAATVALLGPGDFLGEGCIASDQPVRMTSAVANTACSLVKIEKSEMLRALHDEPEFSCVFVSYLIARNNRTQEDLVDQLFNFSERRLARTLFLLADFGKDKTEKIIPNVSQETLAEMIGTTRSRVNYFMNRFRKLGLIEYNGRLLIRNSLLSVVCANKVGNTGFAGISPRGAPRFPK